MEAAAEETVESGSGAAETAAVATAAVDAKMSDLEVWAIGFDPSDKTLEGAADKE